MDSVKKELSPEELRRQALSDLAYRNSLPTFSEWVNSEEFKELYNVKLIVKDK